jgi:hypothetical protein
VSWWVIALLPLIPLGVAVFVLPYIV